MKVDLRSELSDGELMSQLGQGDGDALGEIYQRYVEVVRAALSRSAPELPRAQREELMQDVFVALLEQARRYRDEERLKAFLYGISVRKARMWRRQTWLRKHLLLRQDHAAVGMAAAREGDPAQQTEARQEIHQALALLPEAQREVLLLHAEGFSGDEIAERLQIRPKTVWTRLHRARTALVAVALLVALLSWIAWPKAAPELASTAAPKSAQGKTGAPPRAPAARAKEGPRTGPATAELTPPENSAAPVATAPAGAELKTGRLSVRSAALSESGARLSERARERKLPDTSSDLSAWRKLVLSGELLRAEALLRTHLTLHGRDAAAWSLLGDCLRKASQWKDAVVAYREVIRWGSPPEAERARFLAASVLQDRLHDARAVIALLEGYGADQITTPEAKVRLARALLDVGETTRAQRLLEHVLSLHPASSVGREARRLLSESRTRAP